MNCFSLLTLYVTLDCAQESHLAIPCRNNVMSSTGDMITPIVGLATNQFFPISETQYILACLILPLQCATLLFWAVLLVAIVRDRHYEDANNLLIISFALADIVCTSTSLHTAISLVLDHGYSRGYIGTIKSPE